MIYLLGLILTFWLIKGADLISGLLSMRKLSLPSLPLDAGGVKCLKISLIFAARNEEKAIESALLSMLSQDCPDYEVIAVNDRSADGTGQILNEIKLKYPDKLKVLTISELPKGWLGKTHALYQGYLISSGERLLFTDADVHFAPQTLTAATGFCLREKVRHLTLFPKLILKQYIEACFTGYFALIFNMRFRPWAASNANSKAYAGIGAFNFIERSAYEKIGTHKALALEVADDMMFGKLVKSLKISQAALFGMDFVSVRWVEGVRGVFGSLRKNAYRGVDYNVFQLIFVTSAMFLIDVIPFAGLILFKGISFYLSVCAVTMILTLYLAGMRYERKSGLAFFMHPFTSLLYMSIFWLSAFDVWRYGGVRWRDTLYPIEDLPKTSL